MPLNVALDDFHARCGMAPSIHAPICTFLASQHIARESQGDLNGQRQFAVAHAPVEILVIDDRRDAL